MTIALAMPLTTPVVARAQVTDAAAGYEALRAGDLQLAAIGYRLSVAAAPLCDRLEPGTGLQLHTLEQYDPRSRDAVRAHFGLSGTVGVAGVVPGSPADLAGIERDDSLVAINGIAVPQVASGPATTDTLVALHRRLAALPPSAPISLDLTRAGTALRISLTPRPACFSRYEIRIAGSFDARANGELVQLSSKYIDLVDAALLPVAVAHELSHNILRHRERLVVKGADFGLASGFGRNVGLFRQTEIQADILAIHLLARAGYDPRISARFWREVGPRIMAGTIRSRSHPPLRERIAIATFEAAKFSGGAAPPPPQFWAERAAPLSGEWRTLLPPTIRP